MQVGDSLHVGEVPAPEGVTIVFDVNFTLATVSAPRGASEEGAEEEEGEEAEAADAAESAEE